LPASVRRASVAAMLDRATHLRKDLDFLEAQLGAANTRLCPWHRDLHPVREQRLVMPRISEASELLDAGGELVWLGMLGGDGCFGVDISSLSAPLSHAALRGAELSDMRLGAAQLSAEDLDIAFYARALLGWHARHGFCAACGERSRPREGGHMRECTRAGCGAQHFPRVDPCVLVLVTDPSHERCVLGRQAAWPPGMFSTLAGFVEPGETIEHAVVREVLEETGLHVESARYATSQPWPFPASLMLGFTAVTQDVELRLDDELQDARWFSRQELRALPAPLFVPGPHTLAGRLLADFVK
jgi:NAD+ diphosphatase